MRSSKQSKITHDTIASFIEIGYDTTASGNIFFNWPITQLLANNITLQIDQNSELYQ